MFTYVHLQEVIFILCFQQFKQITQAYRLLAFSDPQDMTMVKSLFYLLLHDLHYVPCSVHCTEEKKSLSATFIHSMFPSFLIFILRESL